MDSISSVVEENLPEGVSRTRESPAECLFGSICRSPGSPCQSWGTVRRGILDRLERNRSHPIRCRKEVFPVDDRVVETLRKRSRILEL
jgi:hypothetical protein